MAAASLKIYRIGLLNTYILLRLKNEFLLPDDVFCFFIAGVHIKLLQYPKFRIVDVSYMPAFVFVPDRRGVLHLDQNFGGNPIQRPLILPSTQCHSPQLPPLLSLNTSLTCAYPPTAVEFYRGSQSPPPLT